MSLFCRHRYEVVGHNWHNRYLLWHVLSTDYFWVFQCRKCDKRKLVPISFEQFYNEDSPVIATSSARKYPIYDCVLPKYQPKLMTIEVAEPLKRKPVRIMKGQEI